MENRITEKTQGAFLLLLSVAAGCVDALAFIHSGTFPANMTGNSVVLALGVLHVGPGGASLAALALLGFCGGTVIGALIARSSKQDTWTPRVSLAFLCAGILVLSCSITLWLSSTAFLPYLIVAVSVAMGIQGAAVLQLGVSGVPTTVVTGALTTGIARLVGAVRHPQQTHQNYWLPLLSWLAYFTGALIGGFQSLFHTGIPIVLPGALLVIVAIVAEYYARRSKG
ncbi:MAG: YoaK family protein [Chthoniobacterales bacterium]